MSIERPSIEQNNIPEVTPVPVTPETDRSKNPLPPELINLDPDGFLDEQGEIDKERRGTTQPPFLQ